MMQRRDERPNGVDVQRIIVGIDGSDASWSAFDTALAHAQGEAVVTAVHVEHLSGWSTLGLGATVGEVYENDAKLRAELGEEAQRRAQQHGVTVEVSIHKGRPSHVLVELATELAAHLVVVAHQGTGGAIEWLGSAANEVVHRAPCSVLVVR